MNPITVYGTEWCEDTQRTRQHLESVGLPYEYVDIEQNAGAAEWVKRQNSGKSRTPTVKLPGLVLSEPSEAELDAALRTRGLLA